MADNNENILVVFDYNNITIVDPNKVVDSEGKAKERYINQENLVMYANLECKVLPRTKLAVGVASNDSVQTISIATINFLRPGDKDFLDNSYTDELTGENSLTGKGLNQPKIEKFNNPNKSNDSYLRQTIYSGGKPGAIDTELLGITSIEVKQGLDFLPVFSIELEDVKGRALFEAGDNSPYAAFFNFPYPLFHLTLKGYVGKAVKLSLMLQSFTSRYDTFSGNFKISLKFFTYKYTILSELSMGYLLATPHMYKSKVNVIAQTGGPSKFVSSSNNVIERGYEKIKEVYSEYKSKGLIPNDFPEMTLVQLREKLDNFFKNEINKFIKQDLTPLDNLKNYEETLTEYQRNVRYYEAGTTKSWFNTYMDTSKAIVLKTNDKVYPFKPEYNLTTRKDAENKLKSICEEYNGVLNKNETVGINGSYTINKVKKSVSIPNSISSSIFYVKPSIDQIDIDQTYRIIKNTKVNPTQDEVQSFASGELSTLLVTNQYFQFEGKGRFIDKTEEMGKLLNVYKQSIEMELTESFSLFLQNKETGIGFSPTIRNVLAVVFASGEAFLRLMDEVHKKAWDVRDAKERINSILRGVSVDNITNGITKDQVVYPWPQMITEITDGKQFEKFKVTYPGDSSVITQTKGYLYDIWPEIEFEEEFINAFVERSLPPLSPSDDSNEVSDVKRLSFNAIEYPVSNQVYGNKEVVKYIYEIYERVLISTYYSRLSRFGVSNKDIIIDSISESEFNNILQSLSIDNPYIINILKQYGINGSNFTAILRSISNDGVGESWQNFIRGIFNTSYLKNYVNNSSFELYDKSILNNVLSYPEISLNSQSKFKELIDSSNGSNSFDFMDIYPFTNLEWCQSGLSNGSGLGDISLVMKTEGVLNYNIKLKSVTNIFDDRPVYPVSNFLFGNKIENVLTIGDKLDKYSYLKTFYTDRFNDYDEQLVTEGNLGYIDYSGLTSYQTTSMFNTPYFMNAIQEGVLNFRNYEQYPYVSAAYYFINSLPLSTLREKYKNDKDNLNYIFASLKKFGAIHKLPYAWILKIGSVWHRYKRYIEDGIDILDNSWSGFSYVNNFGSSTGYTLNNDGSIVDMFLENNYGTSSMMNVGFYPKLINDFNVFFQGLQLFSEYTSTDIQSSLDNNLSIYYADDAVIQKTNLKVIPWSVSVDLTDGSGTFLLPSEGSLINQTLYECFDNNGNQRMDVTGNTSVYNGSVRLFWAAPSYGYFDSSKVIKPTPYQYIKNINLNTDSQENFSINGTGYANISEIFSVFDKDILDLFETEFLNFSKSKYDFIKTATNDVDIENSYNKNFHMLMIKLMKIEKIIGNTSTSKIKFAQEKQLKNINYVLNSFINDNDIVFKYGNPSMYDRRLFGSFTSPRVIEPYEWDLYSIATPNSVPVQGGITLSGSRASYPDEWIALETYVGFSDILELVYKDNGSYITDFFIDMNVAFNVINIKNFAPIIKIYASRKLENNMMNSITFTQLITDFVRDSNTFELTILNSLMIKVGKNLPQIDISQVNTKNRALEGEPVTRVELWESFKALNDKWVSGYDFKTKTLFEDVLLLDRASRNVGDKVLVDIFKLKEDLTIKNPRLSMLVFVQEILVDNHFVVMNLPSYVNFYNVQDASRNPKPRSEGSLEFANSLFGTYLNVDYRESSAKMVCFYGGKPSEQLDLKDNIDYRFRSDAFELTRASDNPLVEDLSNKTDWDKSNKVVGFNVDIGPQNQSIFYSFNVSQDAGLSTSETLEVLNKMANQSRNRVEYTQNLSLYNLYKTRSYRCTISMLGNAMIQPTMYFNLRFVPMFRGPYMITSVSHSIQPGRFETIFEGIRQPVYSLEMVDKYLQLLKISLLDSIKGYKDKTKKDSEKDSKVKSTNVKGQVAEVSKSASLQDSMYYSNSDTEGCKSKVNSGYQTYTMSDTVTTSTITYKDMKDIITSKTSNVNLQKMVFATIYINSNNNGNFQSVGNNYAGISINQNWGASLSSAKKEYYCSRSENIPYAMFNRVDDNLSFLINRWDKRSKEIEGITLEKMTKFWILNNNTSVVRNNNVYTTYPDQDKSNLQKIMQDSLNIFNAIP